MSKKPPTRKRIENQARWHLDRWPTTRAHLRRALLRKVERALDGGDASEAVAWIDEILDLLEAEGVLDDARYAAARAAALHARGDSRRKIASKLAGKGVAADLRDEVLHDADDARAAAALVRKRRMGPFREDPAAHRERDLARLARGGFSYDVARAVLDLDRDAVEALELGLEAGDGDPR